MGKFAKLDLPRHTFLNINVPTVAKYKDFKGVKFACAGRMSQLSEYEEKIDAKGKKYFWAKKMDRHSADDGQVWARNFYDNKFITIVPLSYDATDYDAVKKWQSGVIKQIQKSSTDEDTENGGGE